MHKVRSTTCVLFDHDEFKSEAGSPEVGHRAWVPPPRLSLFGSARGDKLLDDSLTETSSNATPPTNQTLADFEAYAGRIRTHEDAIRKDGQVSDQVARQQAASAGRLQAATLNTMIQMTAMASRTARTWSALLPKARPLHSSAHPARYCSASGRLAYCRTVSFIPV